MLGAVTNVRRGAAAASPAVEKSRAIRRKRQVAAAAAAAAAGGRQRRYGCGVEITVQVAVQPRREWSRRLRTTGTDLARRPGGPQTQRSTGTTLLKTPAHRGGLVRVAVPVPKLLRIATWRGLAQPVIASRASPECMQTLQGHRLARNPAHPPAHRLPRQRACPAQLAAAAGYGTQAGGTACPVYLPSSDTLKTP